MRAVWLFLSFLALGVRPELAVAQARAEAPTADASSQPPSACVSWKTKDLLVALTKTPNLDVAACVVKHHKKFSAFVLRPAITLLAASDRTGTFKDLAKIVDHTEGDHPPDATTRALAARAIGLIRRHAGLPGSLPGSVVDTIEDCLAWDPAPPVRIACMEAAVDARLTAVVPELAEVVAEGDPILRFAAARALTSITGVNHVTQAIADAATAALSTYLDVR